MTSDPKSGIEASTDTERCAPWPGGGKHEDLAVGADLLQHLADLRFKSYVEHAVLGIGKSEVN